MNELPRCSYCTRALTPEVFSWDHVIPVCRGGTNTLQNKVPACKRCNNRKGPLTWDEFVVVMHDNKARKTLITEVLRTLAIRTDQQGDSGPPLAESC